MGSTSSKSIARVAEGVFDWLWNLGRRWWIAGVVLFGAALAGSQIASPDKRVLQVVAAGAIVLGAIRLNSFTGLLVLIPLLPFPKATTYGGTTFAFVLFVFLIWLGKVTLKIEKTQGRSTIDLAMGLLILSYLISFAYIDSPGILGLAVKNFFSALVYMAIAYLVIHLVRTEADLRKLILSITLMAVLVQLTAIYELIFPGRALVPGWIDLSTGNLGEYMREGLEIVNMRVGGAFRDYELLAEFCAMMILLQTFIFLQSKGLWHRLGAASLLGLSSFILLTTVTRGAIVSLVVAGAYLTWKTRHRIRFHTFVLVVVGVLVAGFVLLSVVSSQTRSGNILDRMAGTEFKAGIPDTRQQVWGDAWERVWESPLIGHGPYFSHEGGVRRFNWPHNNYLFYWHIVGILGLAAFLYVLFRLWRATASHAPNLGNASYSGALLLALRGMLLLFIVDQIKIDYIRNATYPYWVWVFFGLIVATSRIASLPDESKGKLELVAEPPPTKPRRVSAVSPTPVVGLQNMD